MDFYIFTIKPKKGAVNQGKFGHFFSGKLGWWISEKNRKMKLGDQLILLQNTLTNWGIHNHNLNSVKIFVF